MTHLADPSAPSVPATAPAPEDAFFRHHGLWAPGVRLFRRLGFRVKAALISLVLLLPVLLLAGALWQARSQEIGFARKELTGAAAMQHVVPFLDALTQVRNAVRAGMGAQVRTVDDLVAGTRRADEALERLAAHLRDTGDPLDLSADVQGLQQAWVKARAVPAGLDEHGRTVFGPVVAAAQALMVRLGDDSNLVLDPEVNSYYLINAMVLTMPNAVERVGQVWGWATHAESRGALDARDQARLVAWLAQAQGDLRDLRTYVGRAVKADPSLATQVDLRRLDAATAFLERAREAVVEGHPTPAAQLYREGRDALAEMNRLYGQTLPVIATLLQQRIDAARQQLELFGVLIVASLLLGAYGFYAFYLVMRGGLLEVERHLQAMADGDLTTQPSPWGSDEVARLMNSLGRMQGSWRGIVGQVHSTSDLMVMAGSQLRAAATDLAGRTDEAASSLERSASALEQTSATVQETADKVQQAAVIAARNADTARQAGSAVDTLVATMQQIQDSSQRIGQIIGTIDRIAFQTNLLSLNAAVEAARAGVHGRGFGVVATEIRSLSGLCSSAAREIKQLVGGSVDQVDAGTATVRQAGDTILSLVREVEQINHLLSEVALAAQEQSVGVAAAGTAVHQIDHITHQNAHLADDTRDAAASLEAQSRELAESFRRFRVSPA